MAFFSPNDKNVEKEEKKALERKPVKRRFNEEHSDAAILEWESDDEIETKTISKSIVLLWKFGMKQVDKGQIANVKKITELVF